MKAHPDTGRVHDNPIEFQPARRYLFWYKTEQQKHPRTMVAKFVALERDPMRSEGDRLVLSGRDDNNPRSFGTTYLSTDKVLGVDNVDQSTKCYANKIVRKKDE